MTGPGDELEHRVRLLEDQVAQLRRNLALNSSDAAAARVLAAGADRDVSETREALRAHTSALNALRETQLEMRQAQLEQRQQIVGLERRVNDGFATMKVGMDRIVELLQDRP